MTMNRIQTIMMMTDAYEVDSFLFCHKTEQAALHANAAYPRHMDTTLTWMAHTATARPSEGTHQYQYYACRQFPYFLDNRNEYWS